MNAVLKEIYETGFTQDADGVPVAAFPTGVSWDTGSILYHLVREGKYHKTLEIGLGVGLSALFICQALRDQGGGLHTAIDPYQESHYKSVGLLGVERAGLRELLRHLSARSFEALPRLVDMGDRFDLAFIDGQHHQDFALVDFFYIDRMLDVGGLIIFDDLWLPGIRRVVSFVLRNREYSLLRVRSEPPLPFWRPIASTILRTLEDPMGLDVRVVAIPQNVAVLRKQSEDMRTWRLRRHFWSRPAPTSPSLPSAATAQ